MAFILPFVGYGIYRLISAKSSLTSTRRMVAAGIAGYFGLVIASLFAGIEFGIQPLLYHTASGHTLYCPYGLNVTIPTMVGEHALLFGWVEFVATALVVKFLQKQEPSLLQVQVEVAK
jgi:cobalt/nickel transport system permease protein